MAKKEQMKVGFLQYDVVWENANRNFDIIFSYLNDSSSDLDILVLPEMFLTGFTMRPERISAQINLTTIDRLKSICQEFDVSICGSLPWKENGKWHNRFFHLDKNTVFAQYDKKHLFKLTGENQRFNGGESYISYPFASWTIRPLICFDLRFPIAANDDKEINLLIYVANWPVSRIYHWKKLLMARAIENQSYVVGVNRLGRDGNRLDYTGQSCIIDYTGEVMVDAEDQQGLFTTLLDLSALEDYRKVFPFRE